MIHHYVYEKDGNMPKAGKLHYIRNKENHFFPIKTFFPIKVAT